MEYWFLIIDYWILDFESWYRYCGSKSWKWISKNEDWIWNVKYWILQTLPHCIKAGWLDWLAKLAWPCWLALLAGLDGLAGLASRGLAGRAVEYVYWRVLIGSWMLSMECWVFMKIEKEIWNTEYWMIIAHFNEAGWPDWLAFLAWPCWLSLGCPTF